MFPVFKASASGKDVLFTIYLFVLKNVLWVFLGNIMNDFRSTDNNQC